MVIYNENACALFGCPGCSGSHRTCSWTGNVVSNHTAKANAQLTENGEFSLSPRSPKLQQGVELRSGQSKQSYLPTEKGCHWAIAGCILSHLKSILLLLHFVWDGGWGCYSVTLARSSLWWLSYLNFPAYFFLPGSPAPHPGDGVQVLLHTSAAPQLAVPQKPRRPDSISIFSANPLPPFFGSPQIWSSYLAYDTGTVAVIICSLQDLSSQSYQFKQKVLVWFGSLKH